MKSIASLSLAAIIVVWLAERAEAALTLNVDPAGKTFYFTGSDEVTGNPSGYVVWSVVHGSVNTSADLTGNTALLAFSAGGFDLEGVWINFLGNTMWDLAISTTNNNSTFTISGLGPSSAVSYAGLANSIVPFEASIGKTFTAHISAGTGQEPMQIVGVPEPSVATLFLGTSALSGCFGRRRGRKV